MVYVQQRMTPEIRAGIFAGESGGDYNALFGFSNRKEGSPFYGTNISDMTLGQVKEFTDPKGPYGQWVKSQVGRVATPTGAYQVVGTTLRAAQRALGLPDDVKYTREVQDQIGEWILQNQGTGAWEGYRGPGDPTTVSTRDDPTTGGAMPGMFGGKDLPGSLLEALGYGDPDDFSIFQAEAAGIDPAPMTMDDRLNTALFGLSDILGAQGAGHASDFATTDAFLEQELARRYGIGAGDATGGMSGAPGEGQDPNQTIEYIRGRPGGAQLVAAYEAGALTMEQLVEEAGKMGITTAAGLPKEIYEQTERLRKELEPQMVEYREIESVYSAMQQAAAQGGTVGDTALITAFNKLLDPGSVVRSEEMDRIAGAGGIERIKTQIQNYLTGHGLLDDTVRNKVLQMANVLYNTRRDRLEPRIADIQRIGEGQGVPADQVLRYVVPGWGQRMPSFTIGDPDAYTENPDASRVPAAPGTVVQPAPGPGPASGPAPGPAPTAGPPPALAGAPFAAQLQDMIPKIQAGDAATLDLIGDWVDQQPPEVQAAVDAWIQAQMGGG